MEGWICLYRKILDWQWYSDKNVRLVFIHLLLKANHKKRKWQNIEIEKGQLITSYGNLATEIGITTQQIRTALNKLKSTGEITIKATNKYTLINIENYGFYQSTEQENNKQDNTQNNNQITNNQQTNNKQITTNNNETIKQCNNNKLNKFNLLISGKEKCFEDEKLNTSFVEWLNYKKQRKEKYTDIGLQKLITQINNQLKIHTSSEIIELIDTCISRNYKGIIFDMLKNQKKNDNNDIPSWVYEM